MSLFMSKTILIIEKNILNFSRLVSFSPNYQEALFARLEYEIYIAVVL